jgi:hypothetical protein
MSAAHTIYRHVRTGWYTHHVPLRYVGPSIHYSAERQWRCWNSWPLATFSVATELSYHHLCLHTTKQRFRDDYGTSYSSFFNWSYSTVSRFSANTLRFK